jgi:hypothetical protein
MARRTKAENLRIANLQKAEVLIRLFYKYAKVLDSVEDRILVTSFRLIRLFENELLGCVKTAPTDFYEKVHKGILALEKTLSEDGVSKGHKVHIAAFQAQMILFMQVVIELDIYFNELFLKGYLTNQSKTPKVKVFIRELDSIAKHCKKILLNGSYSKENNYTEADLEKEADESVASLIDHCYKTKVKADELEFVEGKSL